MILILSLYCQVFHVPKSCYVGQDDDNLTSKLRMLALFRQTALTISTMLAHNFALVITGSERLLSSVVLCSVTLISVLLIEWQARARLQNFEVGNAFFVCGIQSMGSIFVLLYFTQYNTFRDFLQGMSAVVAPLLGVEEFKCPHLVSWAGVVAAVAQPHPNVETVVPKPSLEVPPFIINVRVL